MPLSTIRPASTVMMRSIHARVAARWTTDTTVVPAGKASSASWRAASAVKSTFTEADSVNVMSVLHVWALFVRTCGRGVRSQWRGRGFQRLYSPSSTSKMRGFINSTRAAHSSWRCPAERSDASEVSSLDRSSVDPTSDGFNWHILSASRSFSSL